MTDEQKHSKEELWSRINDLAQDQARTSTAVDSIKGELMTLAQAVDRLAARLNEGSRTNWQSVFAGVTLLLFVGSLAIGPLYQTAGEHAIELREAQAQRVERAHETGQQEARDEWYRVWLEFLEKQQDTMHGETQANSEEAAALRARLDAVEQQLSDVDRGGSRRWVNEQ